MTVASFKRVKLIMNKRSVSENLLFLPKIKVKLKLAGLHRSLERQVNDRQVVSLMPLYVVVSFRKKTKANFQTGCLICML